MSETQKPRLRARFVVHRVEKWAEYDGVRYFLKPLQPDWDPKDNDDPVEQLLYEVKDSQIPRDYEFTHKDKDSRGGGVFGDEGIEIETFDAEHDLELGQIVDLWIMIVGRVEFQ